MGSTAQIGLGIVILGAMFVFGHYVHQNSLSSNDNQQQLLQGDQIVWQSNEAVKELRERLDRNQSPSNDAPQSQVPVSSMPIAGLNNRPVMRKPELESNNTALADPFGESNARKAPPSVPKELPPLNGDVNTNTIIQPDFSDLLAAASQPPANEVPPASDVVPQTPTTQHQGDWAIEKSEPKPTSVLNQAPKKDENTTSIARSAAPHSAAPNRILGTVEKGTPARQMETSTANLKPIASSSATQIRLKANKFVKYQTRANDSLQEISIRYFGKPDYYLDIYVANRDQLPNPAFVPTGIELQIPVYGD